MTTHQPGPWIIGDDGICRDKNGNEVLYMSPEAMHATNDPGLKENLDKIRETSRLIQAAPEMFALLHEAHECIAYSCSMEKKFRVGRSITAMIHKIRGTVNPFADPLSTGLTSEKH